MDLYLRATRRVWRRCSLLSAGDGSWPRVSTCTCYFGSDTPSGRRIALYACRSRRSVVPTKVEMESVSFLRIPKTDAFIISRTDERKRFITAPVS